MAKQLDSILVVDIEATCWEGKPPTDQESEIIEVGLCLLDSQTLERSGKRSLLIRPERSSVSSFCTNLTTLTQEQVAQGISFREACSILRQEYEAKSRVWASFGDYDRRQFERQCAAWQVGYPFGTTHLNVKSLFALSQGYSREVGMARALETLGMSLEGTHHRGDDDAWNIARILGEILRRTRKLHA